MGSIEFVRRDLENRIVERGELDMLDMAAELSRQQRKARKLMDQVNADHVIYGLRCYNRNGSPSMLQLILMPLNESAFELIQRRCRSALVYALHRR